MVKTENILCSVICGVTFAIVILVGFLTAERIDDDHWVSVGFCIDKEGMYNITDYGFELIDFNGELNCSNKENPTQIDTLLMG